MILVILVLLSALESDDEPPGLASSSSSGPIGDSSIPTDEQDTIYDKHLINYAVNHGGAFPPPSLTHRHRPAWKRLAPPSHRPAGQQSASANRCQQRNSLPVPTAQQSAIDCIVHFSRLSYELANALTAAARAAATRDYVESIVSEVLEIVTSTVQPSTSKGKGKGKCKGKGKSE